jgi:SAM-dependent methyltransferase
LEVSYEVVVITKDGDDETVRAAGDAGVEVLLQASSGYGGALIDGLRRSSGDYVLTLDADLAPNPEFVKAMWASRRDADITIASRYAPGGSASKSRFRLYLSRTLNLAFRRGISIPVYDLSSGFRLYRRGAIDPDRLTGTDFDLLEEILIKAVCEGWHVQEIPFHYEPGRQGSPSKRLRRLGWAYTRAFWRLWQLRNSIAAADYDDRAYDSVIPLQRYWQRERFKIVEQLSQNEGAVLDVGCGSSRILDMLPEGSIALDVLIRKLRYDQRFGVPLVQASGFQLPFPNDSFPCVISSQVIEHVPKESPMIDELCRVLQPGGRLVLGTPDYAHWEWVYLEKVYGRVAPGAYADEHISHYTRSELLRLLDSKGLVHEATRYIARWELILAFRKQPT